MKKINEEELKELFTELKYNNKIAFEKLYNRYNKLVYGVAFSILKNKEDSEDIVQSVFSKIYSLDKNKLPNNNETSWLYSVAKNEALILIRKKDNNANLDTIYNLENENNDIDKIINVDSYNRLINGLNKKEQEIVSLKILSNLTFKEIGELLGEPTNTIKWRYYKAIHALKITLSNLGMFIITFVLGIVTLKKQKKETPIIKEDQITNNTQSAGETVNKGNDSFKENATIEDNENTDSFENVVIEDTNISTTNYLSVGIFSISAVFLALAIIFSIFLVKCQLKRKQKTSK